MSPPVNEESFYPEWYYGREELKKTSTALRPLKINEAREITLIEQIRFS